MRDPERISKILERIKALWIKNPDLRLGQLICNVISPQYLYEIDDKVLITTLEKIYDQHTTIYKK